MPSIDSRDRDCTGACDRGCDAGCDCGRDCDCDRAFGGRLAALAKRGGGAVSAGVSGAVLSAFVGTATFAATSAAVTAAAAANSPVVHVHMHDIAFVPQSLAVSPGTTIEWTNDDDMTHTVTSGIDRDDGVWTSSPPIPPGGTFRVVLQKPGTYRYFCKPHVYSAAMHATIVVSDGAASSGKP